MEEESKITVPPDKGKAEQQETLHEGQRGRAPPSGSQETKSEPEPKGLVFQLGQSTELANSEGKKPDEVIQRSNLTIVTHSPQIDEEDKEENQVTILPDSPDTPAYSDARSNWEGETPQKPSQKDYKIIAEYQSENIQSEIEKSILSIVSNIEDGSIIIEEHTLEKNPPGPSEVEKTAGGGGHGTRGACKLYEKPNIR
ncbi:hypothetical protein JTB14_001019 [Gonioctena quinquepunctata]|nr:hypothetical protein JTB14_001019 [Gonioctena quinquepunctata]